MIQCFFCFLFSTCAFVQRCTPLFLYNNLTTFTKWKLQRTHSCGTSPPSKNVPPQLTASSSCASDSCWRDRGRGRRRRAHPTQVRHLAYGVCVVRVLGSGDWFLERPGCFSGVDFFVCVCYPLTLRRCFILRASFSLVHTYADQLTQSPRFKFYKVRA